MFGKTVLLVLTELAPAIRKLVQAVIRGDERARKEAMIELEFESEKAAVKRVRGG